MRQRMILLRVLALLTALCLTAGALSSCALLQNLLTTDNTVRVYEQAARKADKAQSFTGRMELHMSGVKDRVPFDIKLTSDHTETHTPAFSERTSTVTVMNTAGKSEREIIDEGYVDGKAYIITDNANRVYGKMTEQEYTAWHKELSEGDPELTDLLSDIRAAAERTCEENSETGGYTLTITDAGENAGPLMSLLKQMESLIEVPKVEQVTYTLEVDADGYFTHAGVVFAFADSTAKPVFEVTVDFSDWNKTEIKDVDFEKRFTELPDIRLASRIAKAYDALTEPESNHFRVTEEMLLTLGGQRTTYTDVSDVDYFTADDKICYTIDCSYQNNYASGSYTINYADGEQVTITGTNRQTEKKTEAEARQGIRSLSNLAGISLYTVTGMKPGDDDRHFTLDVNVPDTAFGLNFAYSVSSKTAVLEVTLREDGSVGKTVLKAECGFTASGQKGWLTQTTTTEFPVA